MYGHIHPNASGSLFGEPCMTHILILKVVLENTILRMSFLNCVQSFWNWFSTLIRFKDVHHPSVSGKVGNESPWYDVAVETGKISSLHILFLKYHFNEALSASCFFGFG